MRSDRSGSSKPARPAPVLVALPRGPLTTREAAAYCGYRTPGAIRKAVHQGKLRPAGRRGGTGPQTFEIEELHRFQIGAAMPSADHPEPVPILRPKMGAHHDRDVVETDHQVDSALEVSDLRDEDSRRLASEGRGLPRKGSRRRAGNGATERDQKGPPRGRRGNGSPVASKGDRPSTRRRRLTPESEDALRRIRSLRSRKKD